MECRKHILYLVEGKSTMKYYHSRYHIHLGAKHKGKGKNSNFNSWKRNRRHFIGQDCRIEKNPQFYRAWRKDIQDRFVSDCAWSRVTLYQSPANAGSMRHFRFQTYHLPISFVWSYDVLYRFPMGLSDEFTVVPYLGPSLLIVGAVSKK